MSKQSALQLLSKFCSVFIVGSRDFIYFSRMACRMTSEELAINECSTTEIYKGDTAAVKDYSSIERAEEVPSPSKYCYRQKASICEHVVYFCSLAVASYVGVFCRVYLSELGKWDGVVLFPSLYPQMVGTAIMGFVANHKLLLTNSFLYQAIATGLCGSITTFSSWNSEAVSTLLQTGQASPDNAVRVLGWATTLLLGLGMSSAALTLGRHLSSLSPWPDSKQQTRYTQLSTWCAKYRVVEGGIFVGVWLVLTVLVVALPYLLQRRDLLFIGLLATLGTYVRWHISPLNSAFQKFKLGTFLVNVAGSWLLEGVVCMKELYAERVLARDLLMGVASGFCGCLTTVSTFAVELSSLPLLSSYVYAFSSIVLAQVGMILVRGIFQWTSD